MTTTRLIAWCHGRVQGVGFRWWVSGQAKELGLTGSATNYPDGRVLVVAEGPAAQTEKLLRRLQPKTTDTKPSRPGEVTVVVDNWAEPQGITGFERR